DLQSVYWDVLERIKREFDSEGISFPYPQMDIHLVRSGKQAESVTHNSRSVSSRQ
ncbi:mechanosensitive ion channel protein MscS, partial [Escherichia coli]|nr:mechanosensitive ion channel protein MscS [Escherichia coli]